MRLLLVIISHLLRLLGAIAAAVGALLLVMWVIDSGSPANSGELLLIGLCAFAFAAACVLSVGRIRGAGHDDAIPASKLSES